MAVGDSFQAAGILDQLARVGEASAVIAAAVALIGLWLTLRDNRKRNREKDVLEWQKVIVFEIIANRGPIAAADIIRFFGEQEYESLLKNKLLGSLSLDAILISLIADNVIMILPERPTENELGDFSRLWHDGCGKTIIEAQNVDQNHSAEV